MSKSKDKYFSHFLSSLAVLKIDVDYQEVLREAAKVHGPVAHLCNDLVVLLDALAGAGVLRPTDFDFTYNGHIELRWHNGTDQANLSTSSKSFSIVFGHGVYAINGRTKVGHDEKGRVNMEGLTFEACVQISKILYDMVMVSK